MAFIKATGRSDFTVQVVTASEVGTSGPALALIKQCGLLPKPSPHSVIFDSACGGGCVTAQLLRHLKLADIDDMAIICGDLDMTMVELTQRRIAAQGWQQHVRCEKIDAHKTPFDDENFTHVLMNFGPQLMKDPRRTLVETRRILTTGGVIGFTTWLRPGFIPSMKAVFPEWNPGATPIAGEWRDAEKVQEILQGMGFVDIACNTLDVETDDKDVEGYLDLLTNFLMPSFFNESDHRMKYSAHMRQPGKMKMQWQALIVSAKK